MHNFKMKLWLFINDVMFKGRRMKDKYVTKAFRPFCHLAILPTGTEIPDVQFYFKSLFLPMTSHHKVVCDKFMFNMWVIVQLKTV